MKSSNDKATIQVDKQADSLALVFVNFKDLNNALSLIKKNYDVTSSWKNWFSFYLLFFDDYHKSYRIDGAKFAVQPDGFTWMEGLALTTKKSNEAIFDKVVSILGADFEINVKLDSNDKPIFPIKIVFNEDSEELILNTEQELASHLEYFDSEDPEENATVTDANNRPVILKVKKLEIKVFRLAYEQKGLS